jgi:peptidoglycan/xylan/chitin deacetylase (PgdA/CDA1 family)
MKSKIKKIIIFACYYSGLNLLISKFLNGKIFCIGYHSVFDEKNKKQFNQKLYEDISVSTQDFERQIMFLKNNGHTFIHFSDLKSPDAKKLNKPTVIFFDDGFKDVLINALPILRKHNIAATIFITTGLIEKKHMLWTLGLRSFLIKKGYEAEDIEKEIGKFKKLGMGERNEKLQNLYLQNNFVLQLQDLNIFLNWPEVVELSNNNFEIGSHGVIHEKLVELPGNILKETLVNSKGELERILKKPVDSFSYPYGRYNDKVIKMVESAGYKLAVSGLPGYDSFGDAGEHPLGLKRIDPKPRESIAEFAFKIYMHH